MKHAEKGLGISLKPLCTRDSTQARSHYVFNTCGKRSHQSSDLVDHTRVHTWEKPYLCSLCGERFSSSTGLTTHFRIHTDDMPLSCKICWKKFRQSAGLAAHVRVHAGEKPFSWELFFFFFLLHWQVKPLQQHAYLLNGMFSLTDFFFLLKLG